MKFIENTALLEILLPIQSGFKPNFSNFQYFLSDLLHDSKTKIEIASIEIEEFERKPSSKAALNIFQELIKGKVYQGNCLLFPVYKNKESSAVSFQVEEAQSFFNDYQSYFGRNRFISLFDALTTCYFYEKEEFLVFWAGVSGRYYSITRAKINSILSEWDYKPIVIYGESFWGDINLQKGNYSIRYKNPTAINNEILNYLDTLLGFTIGTKFGKKKNPEIVRNISKEDASQLKKAINNQFPESRIEVIKH